MSEGMIKCKGETSCEIQKSLQVIQHKHFMKESTSYLKFFFHYKMVCDVNFHERQHLLNLIAKPFVYIKYITYYKKNI